MCKIKIVLCIVEGLSDKDSLGLLLSRLFKPYVVEFYIIKGDVTSEFQSKPYNIETKLKRFIDLFLKDHKGIKKSDIHRVIHLVDMDGVYVDPNQIMYSKEAYKNKYHNNHLLSNKVDNIIKRNIRKQDILNRLHTTSIMWGIPYQIYYFSCHLEHVLHNQLNVDSEKKDVMAMQFIDSYINHQQDFVALMQKVSKKEQFIDSWEYIKEGNHSIERASNFFIGMKEIIQEIKGESNNGNNT